MRRLTNRERQIVQHTSDSGDGGVVLPEGTAKTILAAVIIVGVGFLLFGSNDNFPPDPDDDDDRWYDMFVPKWFKPGH